MKLTRHCYHHAWCGRLAAHARCSTDVQLAMGFHIDTPEPWLVAAWALGWLTETLCRRAPDPTNTPIGVSHRRGIFGHMSAARSWSYRECVGTAPT